MPKTKGNASTLTPGQIREIRERLHLSQADAGDLIGGGPRAFTKYETGAITPNAAVINLLILLDRDPSKLADLGGGVPPPIAVLASAPLEVTAEHIKVLKPPQFAELVRQLLIAEAQANQIPLGGVHVPRAIETSDGGEDGRIVWTAGPDHTEFLLRRQTLLQLKAGPITRLAAGKDVLLKKGGGAKPRVADILAQGGVYMMLCGQPYVGESSDLRAQEIRDQLRATGVTFDDAQVAFRDGEWIANWCNRHRTAAIWVLERTQPGLAGPFRTWGPWATQHEASPLVDDPRLRDIGPWLRSNLTEPRGVARLLGLSGLGKSRLALEALAPAAPEEMAQDNLGHLVLYASEPEQTALAIRNAVQLLIEAKVRAVIVVDRCPPDARNELEALVTRSDSQLSLLTIFDEVPGETLKPNETIVPIAPDGMIEAMIVQALPSVGGDNVRLLSQFADGNPQMARLVSQAWKESRPLPEATDSDLVDAIVHGRRTRDADLVARAAPLLAVYGLVGVRGDVDQLPLIAPLGRDLSADDLRVTVKALRGRGLIQSRGRAITLQPRPIALSLARRQWELWSDAQWDEVLTGSLDITLRERAVRTLALLNTTGIAVKVARHIMRRDGPFDDATSFASGKTWELLPWLAEIDATATGKVIERLLDGADIARMHRDLRRALVRAIERIAFPQASFELGAALMLRLAKVETESWANNATGQFASLFPVVLGDTAAPPRLRLDVLDEALDTQELDQLRVVVKALLEGAKTRMFSRGVGPEQHGARPALRSWAAGSSQEALDYIGECVVRLTTLATRDDEIGTLARKGLGQEFQGLINAGLDDRVEVAVDAVRAKIGYWPEAVASLAHLFSRGKAEGLTEERKARLGELLERLKPSDLIDRARNIVTDMPWDYPSTEAKLSWDQRNERKVAAVEAFATEVIAEPGGLDRLLPNLTHGSQRMGFAYGRAIALGSPPPELLAVRVMQAMVEPHHERVDFEVLAGVLDVARDGDATFVESFKSKLAGSALADGLPLIAWRLGITPADISLAIEGINADRIKPFSFMQWTMGGVLAELPPAEVAPLFDVMMAKGGEMFAIAIEVMGMYGHDRLERFEALRPQLLQLAAGAFQQRPPRATHMDEHHFKELLGWLLEKGEADPDAREVARVLARNLGADRADHGLVEGLLPILLSNFAQTVWPLIGQAIVEDQAKAWRIEYALERAPPNDEANRAVLALPVETLFGWCHANPDKGPAFMAKVLPLFVEGAEATEPSLHPMMARLLEEFGDRQDVLDALSSNMGGFFWGSLADHYAQKVKGLSPLLEHRHSRVRRWMREMVDYYERSIEADRDDDAERRARWE